MAAPYLTMFWPVVGSMSLLTVMKSHNGRVKCSWQASLVLSCATLPLQSESFVIRTAFVRTQSPSTETIWISMYINIHYVLIKFIPNLLVESYLKWVFKHSLIMFKSGHWSIHCITDSKYPPFNKYF